MGRDEFNAASKRILAQNSSYFCNNPSCRNTTVFSSSNPEKPSKIGVAAHICAASTQGPRFDSSQTAGERASHNNGIWLCANCSILIDRDEKRYSVPLLKSWKEQHQRWLHENNHFLPFEELKFRLCEKSLIQIEQNKRIHKYIPEIYTEFTDIKEVGRFFSDPCKFWNKLIDLLEITDFNYLCDFLDEFKIYNFDFNPPSELKRNIHINELYHASQILDSFLNIKLQEIEKIQKLILDINTSQNVPLDLKYKFENIKSKFWTLINFTSKLEKLKRLNNAIKCRVFVITSSAGKGKTNFLCDLSENLLSKCEIPFLSVNASELNESDNISSCFLDLAYTGTDRINLHNFGTSYRLDFENRNSAFIIVIDGLNEIVNIDNFRRKLISFIEISLKYDFIKLILTCRDKYFEERFYNFDMLPQDLVLLEKNFNEKVTEINKSELWISYLKHFDVVISRCSEETYNKLTTDPLLLRMFCEVNNHKTINFLDNLYKVDLFNEYLEKKRDNINISKSTAGPLNVLTNAIFSNVFKKLIEFMIFNRKYSDVKVEDLEFDESEIRELSRIINEDILLKMDLKNNDVLSTSHEVISFTFDEFRDFLISDQLVHNLYEKNRGLFDEFLNRAIVPDSTIFEGVSTYLFNISKREGNGIILQKLEQQSWFDSVFITEIFNIEEKYISSKDIDNIKSIFLEGRSYHNKLLMSFLYRLNVKKDKKLNISILFAILKNISEEQYESLILSRFAVHNFESSIESSNKIDLHKYFDSLVQDLSKGLVDNDIRHSEFKLLVLFMGGRGPVSEKACSIFSNYSKKHPERSKEVIDEFKEIGISKIRENIIKI